MASKTVSKEVKSTSQTVSRKSIYRSSKNGCFAKVNSSNKKAAMSESDELTLRAWKHTYANRRKNED